MIINNFSGFKGVYEIESEPAKDYRGEFKRTYDDIIFRKHGLCTTWVQDNHSISFKKNTIRGLHFQKGQHAEIKLVRCTRGEILDVFADIREESETFGKCGYIVLSESNNKMIYIPKGFAHGYRCLTDKCEILYKVDNYYSPHNESGVRWNDPDLNIDWKLEGDEDIIMSEKDRKLPLFDQNKGA